jgi:hypothetical protein
MTNERIGKQILIYKPKVPETGKDTGIECMSMRSGYCNKEETY